MIADNIKNVDIYASISPDFERAVELMKEIWQSDRKIKDNTVIVPDRISYRILEPQNRKAPKDSRFEAHKKFIDIHFILSGSERALIADPANLDVIIPYAEERDIAFYSGETAKDILLREGDFYIAYPWDAHAPDLQTHLNDGLRKAVIKIRY